MQLNDYQQYRTVTRPRWRNNERQESPTKKAFAMRDHQHNIQTTHFRKSWILKSTSSECLPRAAVASHHHDANSQLEESLELKRRHESLVRTNPAKRRLESVYHEYSKCHVLSTLCHSVFFAWQASFELQAHGVSFIHGSYAYQKYQVKCSRRYFCPCFYVKYHQYNTSSMKWIAIG